MTTIDFLILQEAVLPFNWITLQEWIDLQSTISHAHPYINQFIQEAIDIQRDTIIQQEIDHIFEPRIKYNAVVDEINELHRKGLPWQDDTPGLGKRLEY